jgi:hypothetical protein
VLRYLRRTRSRCLLYASDSPLQLHANSDATWASDSVDRSSTTGYCILLGSSPISWKSKKQAVISRSSAEAELRALATTTAEIIWLRWLLNDLGVSCDTPTPPLCDNMSAIQISHDPVKHELTKYIGVDASLLDLIVSRRLLILNVCPQNLSWQISSPKHKQEHNISFT